MTGTQVEPHDSKNGVTCNGGTTMVKGLAFTCIRHSQDYSWTPAATADPLAGVAFLVRSPQPQVRRNPGLTLVAPFVRLPVLLSHEFTLIRTDKEGHCVKTVHDLPEVERHILEQFRSSIHQIFPDWTIQFTLFGSRARGDGYPDWGRQKRGSNSRRSKRSAESQASFH
jgi:hypothetical protein